MDRRVGVDDEVGRGGVVHRAQPKRHVGGRPVGQAGGALRAVGGERARVVGREPFEAAHAVLARPRLVLRAGTDPRCRVHDEGVGGRLPVGVRHHDARRQRGREPNDDVTRARLDGDGLRGRPGEGRVHDEPTGAGVQRLDREGAVGPRRHGGVRPLASGAEPRSPASTARTLSEATPRPSGPTTRPAIERPRAIRSVASRTPAASTVRHGA